MRLICFYAIKEYNMMLVISFSKLERTKKVKRETDRYILYIVKERGERKEEDGELWRR